MSLHKTRLALRHWPAWLTLALALLTPLTLPILADPAPGVARQQGAQDAGVAFNQYPTTIAGTTSSGTIRTLRVDDDGAITTAPGATPNTVEGVAADGGSTSGVNPVLIGGMEAGGTNLQNLITSAGGRLIVTAGNDGGTVGGFLSSGSVIDAVATAACPTAVGFTYAWNGTTWDRARTANGASNTIGTGLLGSSPLVYDGASYQLSRQTPAADAQAATGIPAVALVGYNGATYDRLLFTASPNFGLLRSAITFALPGSDGFSNTLGWVQDNTGQARSLISSETAFNETTWDRTRNNTDATVLTSAARTTTQTTTFTNYNSTYLRVVLDVTAAGTGSITLSIDAQDAVSGKWVNLLTGAPVTTISTNVYRVGPGLTAVANATANDFLSRNMRVVVTHNNANSITYSVGRQLTGS